MIAESESLTEEISLLGSKTDTSTLIEKLHISQEELKLNDALVGSIYNRIAIAD